jgi:hypothetical protein
MAANSDNICMKDDAPIMSSSSLYVSVSVEANKEAMLTPLIPVEKRPPLTNNVLEILAKNIVIFSRPCY